MFSWMVLMMDVSLRPFTTSSYTHILTVGSNRASCAALAPTMRAIALPLRVRERVWARREDS